MTTRHTVAMYTSVASVAWGDVHLRVYFQDKEGYVREGAWDGSWSRVGSLSRIFSAKLKTPLAAITYTSGGTRHIRIYYVDTYHTLQERCWDGNGWHLGSLGDRKIKVYYHSKIAACSWTETPHIRVYYQPLSSAHIQEECWDGNGWQKGAQLIQAPLGTGLAVVQFGSVHLRLYYQDANHKVQEHCWDGGWKAGSSLSVGNDETAISAITWSNNDGTQLRVYYEGVTQKGEGIVEMTNSNGWSEPLLITGSFMRTGLGACNWGNAHIRFYFQKVDDKIHEFCWDGEWVQGSILSS